MIEKIKESFKDLLTALQTARLYGVGHPITRKSIEKAYASLREAFGAESELVIGIIGEEVAFEKEIFFDLSKLLKQMIIYLKERGVEKIAIKRELALDELNKFIEFLAKPKEETKLSTEDFLLLSGIKNITLSKVKDSSVALKKEADLTNLYQSTLDEVSDPLEKILNQETVDTLTLKLAINNIVSNLGFYYQQLFRLATLKRYDVGTFAHLLNVSILSIYFSSKLGFAEDDVMDIGLSALFHDIGKLYISRKTIRKPSQLSAEEFTQMESHTVLGSKLLMQYVDSVGIMPVVVSFEHHLKYDLSGYPRLPLKKKQHIASSIVSICDVYDALSERRSYKADYPPDMIHGLMMRGSGTAFEPGLLDSFFAAIGVWPVGTIISLSDKRVAVITQENEDNIFLPIVKIIAPENSGELVDLKENKDNIKIDHYLSPWSEGKEFLRLI